MENSLASVGAISTALTGSLRRGARYSESRFADRRSPAAVNLQSGTFPESAVAPRAAPRERVLVGPGQVSNRPPGPNPSHLPTYIHRLDFCATVISSSLQVELSVERAMTGDLDNPRFRVTLQRVKQPSSPMQVEERVLNNVLSFARVSKSSKRDRVDQSSETMKEKLHRFGRAFLQANHQMPRHPNPKTAGFL